MDILHEDLCTYIYNNIWLNSSYNEMFQMKFVETVKTHILCPVFCII